MRNFLLGIFFSYAVLLFAQHMVRNVVGFSLPKGESNYFSTLNRIQCASRNPNEIVLLGSSITGRLPGRHTGEEQVGNLGVDGGSTVEGLIIYKSSSTQCNKLILCETNTILSYQPDAKSILNEAVSGVWFKLGNNIQHLEIGSRPSYMCYGIFLKLWRNEAKTLNELPPLKEGSRVLSVDAAYKFAVKDQKIIDEAILKIKELKRADRKILLVRYPASIVDQETYERVQSATAVISYATGIPYLDLEAQIPRQELDFTDSVHLSDDSASKILKLLRKNYTD
jgi:hypothetical protein